jgi:hypothetical protein
MTTIKTRLLDGTELNEAEIHVVEIITLMFQDTIYKITATEVNDIINDLKKHRYKFAARVDNSSVIQYFDDYTDKMVVEIPDNVSDINFNSRNYIFQTFATNQ